LQSSLCWSCSRPDDRPPHEQKNPNYPSSTYEVSVSERKEITNLDELSRLRLADEGYIVVTSGSQATIHKVNAECISTTNFKLKVIINERKQGSYFWVDSVATAAKQFSGAKRCRVCKPPVLLVDPSTFEAR
jgi:hypothetical protein